MTLKRIRLELARTPEAPEGNPFIGFEFTAPLDKKGRLDLKQWAREKDKCTVRHFRNSIADEHGKVKHHRGSNWVFAWPRGEADDEPIYRFDKHTFINGEYVSITEHDGVARPFRIVSVDPAA